MSGRRIAVLWDVGEEEKAVRRVAALRAAGAEARWVDLRALGLEGGKRDKDVSDYLVKRGGSTEELRRLIRRARREA